MRGTYGINKHKHGNSAHTSAHFEMIICIVWTRAVFLNLFAERSQIQTYNFVRNRTKDIATQVN